MNTGEITSPTFLIITRFSRCSRPKGELDSFARRHTLIFHLPFVISILFIPFSFSLSLSFRRYVLVWFASDCTMTTMQHGVISFFFLFFDAPLAAAFRFSFVRRTIVSRARKLVDGVQEMPAECPVEHRVLCLLATCRVGAFSKLVCVALSAFRYDDITYRMRPNNMYKRSRGGSLWKDKNKIYIGVQFFHVTFSFWGNRIWKFIEYTWTWFSSGLASTK